ncbi:hypothetical protein VEE63_25370 [Escherichia coli]|nr:hypothetical protein VEE63_25370 [Escherichia coli]
MPLWTLLRNKGLNLQSKCNKKRSTHQLEYNFVSTQKPLPNDEYFLPTSYNKRARKDNDFTRTGQKQAEIAKALGRSSSTISRELKRHALESYSATNAQNSYLKHRQNSKAQRKLEQPEYFNLVQEKFLTENWSPEQISARLKLEKSELSISYSTIYRGIYSGLFDIGERKASRKLRHKGKTRHTKTIMKNVAKFRYPTI